MKKKLTLKTEVEKTIKLLVITLAVLIVTLGGALLILNSQSAQKGYLLEQVRLQNDELRSLSENLKAKVMDASTSSKLEEELSEKDMEKTPQENTKYLLPEDNN
jgi:hypothetical protein